MILPFVDCIYVINLPERTDRRREIRAQFETLGWDPDDPKIIYFDAIKPAAPNGFPSIGAHGCFMSHLSILRLAARARHQAIAIFEDDLDFADDFHERIGAVEAALSEQDWSIFYGGYEAPAPIAHDAPVKWVAPAQELRTTHFICLKGAAIPALRDYFEAMLTRPPGDPAGGPMHVDGAYQWYRRAHTQSAYAAATPPLGHQRSSMSDIAGGRWFDAIPGLASLASLARRVKRMGA